MAMQFHNLIEALFGSKVKIKVLRTLWRYKEREFTVRELAKFLGLSHTGINKVLGELEDANAINVRTIGRSFAFKLNKNSYAAQILERIFEMERRSLDELQVILRRRLESPLVMSAALFGSIAEEREMPRSDIDLLIVTEHKGKVEAIVSDLQKEVSEKFGNPISAYFVSEDGLLRKRKQSPIKQALQNHVLICGQPIK
jgi:predicted nucleotidyltransferase